MFQVPMAAELLNAVIAGSRNSTTITGREQDLEALQHVDKVQYTKV